MKRGLSFSTLSLSDKGIVNEIIRNRLHSANGYLSPEAFEEQLVA
ncbi:hypothetical protein ACJJIE_01830 [Microbulbifer sp. TRSA001]